jgi:hypothetical protein
MQNGKMSSSKKFNYKGTLWLVFIFLRPPALLGFCNFVGSESGQIQSVKTLPTQLNNPILSQPHTASLYCNLTQGRGGGAESLYRSIFLKGRHYVLVSL